jgi:hypothetical protein
MITYASHTHMKPNSAIQWVRQTNNAKLLEALCERGLQITETARECLKPPPPENPSRRRSASLMGHPPPPIPTVASICDTAIERGQAKFQATVKLICEASIDCAKLPRVLAFVIAEYAVYERINVFIRHFCHQNVSHVIVCVC